MKPFGFLLILALTLFPTKSLFSSELAGTTKNGQCIVTGKLDSITSIYFMFQLAEKHEYTYQEQEEFDQSLSWFRSRNDNLQPVTQVVLKVNDHSVYIPQSAFADLYLINNIVVTKKKNVIHLHVMGADAGYAYDAYFSIIQSPRYKDRYRISERTLRDSEFSTELWENTKYYDTLWESNL